MRVKAPFYVDVEEIHENPTVQIFRLYGWFGSAFADVIGGKYILPVYPIQEENAEELLKLTKVPTPFLSDNDPVMPPADQPVATRR